VKILLINFNPVVSRLFALCTRDAHIELDEVEDIDTVEKEKYYDLMFVDDASYVDSVKEFIGNQNIGKKVFISYEPGTIPGFNITLKKPFLPSQILSIMENVTVIEEVKEKEDEELMIFPLNEKEILQEEKEEKVAASIFPLAKEEVEEEEIVPESPHILDSREIEKIKDLLDMEEDEALPVEEELPEEVVEQRKVEAITAQLIADGLEIVEEEEIVETIHAGKKSKKKKKREDTGPFSKEEFDAVQKVFREALFTLKPKKIKKLLKGKKVELKLKLKDQD
jgi:hypothetical protein